MVLTSFVEENQPWIRIRLLLDDGSVLVFCVLSWPCTVVIVLFCVRACHPGMMNQIPVLNAILDLHLSVFNAQ